VTRSVCAPPLIDPLLIDPAPLVEPVELAVDPVDEPAAPAVEPVGEVELGLDALLPVLPVLEPVLPVLEPVDEPIEEEPADSIVPRTSTREFT